MKLKYISWLPAVIVMVMIFCFSDKPAVDSNEGSMTIAESLVNIYITVTDNPLEEEKNTNLIENINHLVRKCSHFCEYALLAFTFALCLLSMRKKSRYSFALPVLLSALYATTDEFHQTFIPGRSGQLSDVLLDTAGAAVGAILFVILVSIINHHRRKQVTRASQ